MDERLLANAASGMIHNHGEVPFEEGKVSLPPFPQAPAMAEKLE